jgi:lipopolysaccharide heptosyltransferase I
MAASQKFLIIRLSSIGDIVHALPAVAALGETFPRAEIDWVVERRHALLLEGNAFVHRLIPLDTLGWRKNLKSARTLQSVSRGIAALRELHYDAAIDFQGLYKSAVIAWLSRAKERVGFNERWLREPTAAALYTSSVSPREETHVIEMNLALVEFLGVPRLERERWRFPLPASAADEEYIANQLKSRGVGEFIIVNPGGGWKSKCWSPEDYAAVIRQLAGEFPGHFLLTGSPDEEGLCISIAEKSGTARAAFFPSTIPQFIALARRAKLLVGGDTGPLQLAAAVRTPIVAIFGPTDPARNGPFAPADITLWNRGPIDYTRRSKNAGWISGISAETVVTAIRTRLARKYG